MIRKQIYIEPRQEKLLKALAEELGMTKVELIRNAIDRGLAGMAGCRTDPAAWKDAERYILGKRRSRDCLPLRAKSTSIYIGANWKRRS